MVTTRGKKNKDYIPDKGNIIWIHLESRKGHEQKGRRPALVLTPQRYNEVNDLMMVCPITSRDRKFPFQIPFQGEKVGGLIMIDQLRTIDWKSRQVEFVEFLDEEIQQEVTAKLETILKG